MSKRDILVTWPKTRPLDSYFAEIRKCWQVTPALHINYRVGSPPIWDLELEGRRPRLYRVWDGFVRGYTPILSVEYKEEGEVARVESDPNPEPWPEGWYIVCKAWWYPWDPIPVKGFRGWRWFDPENPNYAQYRKKTIPHD